MSPIKFYSETTRIGAAIAAWQASPMPNPLLRYFRTRRVLRAQALRKRLGMAAKPVLDIKYLRIHMRDVNPERRLS